MRAALINLKSVTFETKTKKQYYLLSTVIFLLLCFVESFALSAAFQVLASKCGAYSGTEGGGGGAYSSKYVIQYFKLHLFSPYLVHNNIVYSGLTKITHLESVFFVRAITLGVNFLKLV